MYKMGGSVSKTTIDQLTEAITNVAMNTVQSCIVNSDQTQTVNLVNTGVKIGGGTKISQSTDVSSSCFSSTQKQAELQTGILNAIAQSATADGVALIGAFGASTAEATTNLSSIIKNSITMENIQQSYNTIKQTQTVNSANLGYSLFETLDISQGAKVFAAATINEVAKAGILNKIETHIDQKTKATTTGPLDFLANAFTSMWFLVAMLVVVGIIAFVMIFKYATGAISGQM